MVAARTDNQPKSVATPTKAHLPGHPDAELITSELATNAVEHTRTGPPSGLFTATVKRHSDDTAEELAARVEHFQSRCPMTRPQPRR